jgi:hypothetical protein
MDVTVFTDPTKMSGMWYAIHIDGIYAITDDLKKAFEININAKCDNFKCKKCQPHFRKFIDTHPLKNYWNIRDANGRDIGFFKWTWELHNAVNKFLNKYQPTFEEAYNYYSNSEVGACFNCGDKSTAPPIIPSFNNIIATNIPEQRTKAIPPILTEYREKGNIKPIPFKLISRK